MSGTSCYQLHPDVRHSLVNLNLTLVCFWLLQVDPVRNLLYVKGMVPGHKGNFLLVKDAVKKSFEQQPPRPLPTYLGELPDVTVAPPQGLDPFDYKES